MPRYVDHEARRRHVAEVAADLAASGGLERLTVRNVAEAAGYSTAVVSHYFADKRDLLEATYDVVTLRSRARFEHAAATSSEPLRDCLEALLPLDNERRLDWRLWFVFWGMAVNDSSFAALQRDRTRSARARIRRVLGEEHARGRITADLDLRHTSRELLVVIHGISTQAVFDPSFWTAGKQRAALGSHLEVLAPASHHRAR